MGEGGGIAATVAASSPNPRPTTTAPALPGAASLPPARPSASPGPANPLLKEAEGHPLVKDILKRFAADVVRREPLDHAAWLAKLRREADGGAGS